MKNTFTGLAAITMLNASMYNSEARAYEPPAQDSQQIRQNTAQLLPSEISATKTAAWILGGTVAVFYVFKLAKRMDNKRRERDSLELIDRGY